MNRLNTFLSTLTAIPLLIFSTPSEAHFTKILTSEAQVRGFCREYKCTSVIDLGDGSGQYRVHYEYKDSGSSGGENNGGENNGDKDDGGTGGGPPGKDIDG